MAGLTEGGGLGQGKAKRARVSTVGRPKHDDTSRLA